MKTLILYTSKHGTTEKISKEIAINLDNREVEILNFDKAKNINLGSYESVIIGSSIHIGKIPSNLKKFCEANEEILLQKELGLFICCMQTKEIREDEFRNAFSERLRAHSKANGIMGGEFRFEKMNFIEKLMVKKISGIDRTISEIDTFALENFINKFEFENSLI